MIDPPSIYCDEDVPAAVRRGLVRLGIDTTSAASESKLGLQDQDQLDYAISFSRVLLTHNVEDFPRIHRNMMTEGKHHSGIIVGRQDLAIGEIIRRVARVCAALSAEDMRERLEYGLMCLLTMSLICRNTYQPA